jgi:enoyl-CoA hydratase/carnithine racemase
MFDFNIIKLLEECLNAVEKGEGPAVLVTIGTGSKIFSSGFDLEFWKRDKIDQLTSIVKM